MTQELKDKWVAALRSGEYTQTTGALRNEAGYCCLGVLREIVSPGCKHAKFRQRNEELLAPAFWKRLKTGIEQDVLTELNDGFNSEGGYSFKVIADYIEETVEVTA